MNYKFTLLRARFQTWFYSFQRFIYTGLVLFAIIMILVYALNSFRAELYRVRGVNQRWVHDLNHLVYVIDGNFALLNFSYRMRGFDLAAASKRVKHELLTSRREIDINMFHTILAQEFRPLMRGDDRSPPIGHFFIFPPEREIGSRRRAHAELHDYPEAYDLATRATCPACPLCNVPIANTSIIEQGRVAYMAINSLQVYNERLMPGDDWQWHYTEQFIMDFYDKIQGFEHLIIDMRNNHGGWTTAFSHFILEPNIDEAMHVYGNVFTLHRGEFSQRAVSESMSMVNSGFRERIGRGPSFVMNQGRGLIPLEEMLYEFELPQLNMHDMEHIQYGFQVRYLLRPRRLPRFNNQPAFDGKIWLLTGNRTGSAAHIASWWARDTGFATLVGDETGGNFGGNRAHILLPFSGIRVQMDVLYFADRYGYGIEAGIVPHYRSRPGLNALETVLALIDEGWAYGG